MNVEQAGVDTWSVGWYVGEDSSAARAFAELANVKTRRGARMEEQVLGHVWGWFPGSNLVYAEGHPSLEPGRLAPAGVFPQRQYELWEAMRDFGIKLPEPRSAPGCLELGTPGRPGLAGVRRVDATVDVRFDAPAEGLAVLAGCAALPLPRMQHQVWHEAGGPAVETVSYHGHAGGKMLGRIYDGGVKRGTAPRGTLIRFEDQRRYGTRERMEAQVFGLGGGGGLVAEQHRCRFRPLWHATEGVTVGTAHMLAARLLELQEQEVISARRAESLAGFLLLESAAAWEGTGRTHRRRRADARELGLVLAPAADEEVRVELSDVLAEALTSDAWGADG